MLLAGSRLLVGYRYEPQRAVLSWITLLTQLLAAVQELRNLATKDPDRYISTLVACLVSQDLKWATHPHIRSLYVDQFRQSPPPNPLNPNLQQVFRGNIACTFLGLYYILVKGRRDTDLQHNILCQIIDQWPKVFLWLDFLYRLETDTKPLVIRRALEDVFAFVTRPIWEKAITGMVAKTPGVLPLAIEMYTNLGRRPPPELVWIESAAPVSQSLISLLIHPSSDLRAIPQTVGYQRHHATDALLLPIRLSAEKVETLSSSLLLFDVHAVLFTRSQFYQCLPVHKILSFLCSCFSTFISFASDNTLDSEMRKTAHECCATALERILNYLCSMTDDHRCAMIVLRNNVLAHALKWAAYATDYEHLFHVEALLESLRTYLMYQPVLRLVLQTTSPTLPSEITSKQITSTSKSAADAAISNIALLHAKYITGLNIGRLAEKTDLLENVYHRLVFSSSWNILRGNI
ncbi:hypothetical protein H0H93_007529 [Arthromyces matolae]|nr:hypothetical protein H0H93_007529 [Arthromyces matolae]